MVPSSPTPEMFDVRRNEGPPMSFASGIHYCLGANLARAEGQEVFGALIERFATIELDGGVTHPTANNTARIRIGSGSRQTTLSPINLLL